MNFDEVDAPQFVDFSRANFDDDHMGDSWFLPDNDVSTDVTMPDDAEFDDFSVTVLPDIPSTSGLLPLPKERFFAPALANINPPLLPVSVDANAETTITRPPNLMISSEALDRKPSSKQPPATPGDQGVARWRRATKRASLSQKRGSLTRSAARKSLRRAKERIQTPTKTEPTQKTDESLPKRPKFETHDKKIKSQTNARIEQEKQDTPFITLPRPKTILDTQSNAQGQARAGQGHGDQGMRIPKKQPTTKSQTPTFLKRKRLREVEAKSEAAGESSKPQSQRWNLFTAFKGSKGNVAFSGLPTKTPVTVTKIRPFNFETENRGLKKWQETKPKFTASEDERNNALFPVPGPAPATAVKEAPGEGAKEAPVLQPKSGRRRRTVFKEFHFHTDDRAQAWDEFNAVRARNEANIRELQDNQKREAEERDKEEVRRFRETLVHKAMPVLQGRPLIFLGSNKSLTLPESPELSYKLTQAKRDS